MATTVIRNSILSGCIAGMMAQRAQAGTSATVPTPTDFAAVANVADAIAGECITQNTALGGAAMADADNAQIGVLCLGSAAAAMEGVNINSVVAADYIRIANQIIACAKQTAAKLL